MTTATTERPQPATVFADTLGHDLMKLILSVLRTMPDHWARMNEAAQGKRIAEIRDEVSRALTEAAGILMNGQFQSIACSLEGITIKDDVKIGLTMKPGDANRHALYDAKGKEVLLVLASTEQYLARMNEIKPDKDQRDMLDDAVSVVLPLDQKKYRKDEDAHAPLGMTWEALKNKLNESAPAAPALDTKVDWNEAGMAGVIIVWPSGEREPIEGSTLIIHGGETLVQALERHFPGCQFITPPADYLDTLGADIVRPFAGIIEMRKPATEHAAASPWEPLGEDHGVTAADDQTIRSALQAMFPEHEFRAVRDGDPRPTDFPQDQGQVEEGPLPAGADTEASQLHEALTEIGMVMPLAAIKMLMPEQRALTRSWLGDWSAAYDEGVALDALPARPHFLPLFAPFERECDKPVEPTAKKKGGKGKGK